MSDILMNFIKNDFKGTSISDLISDLYKNNFSLLRDMINNYDSYENTLFKAFPSISKLSFMEEREMFQRGLNENVKTEDIEIGERAFVSNTVEVEDTPSEEPTVEDTDDGFYKDLMEQQQAEIDAIEAKKQAKKEAAEKAKEKRKKQNKKAQERKKQEEKIAEDNRIEERRKQEEIRKNEENKKAEAKQTEEAKKLEESKKAKSEQVSETPRRRGRPRKNPETSPVISPAVSPETPEITSSEKRNREYFDEDKETERAAKEAKLKAEREAVRKEREDKAKQSAEYKSIGNEGIDFSGKGKHLAYEEETTTKTEEYKTKEEPTHKAPEYKESEKSSTSPYKEPENKSSAPAYKEPEHKSSTPIHEDTVKTSDTKTSSYIEHQKEAEKQEQHKKEDTAHKEAKDNYYTPKVKTQDKQKDISESKVSTFIERQRNVEKEQQHKQEDSIRKKARDGYYAPQKATETKTSAYKSTETKANKEKYSIKPNRVAILYNEKNENIIKSTGRSFSSYSPDGIVANIEKKNNVQLINFGSNLRLVEKDNKVIAKNTAVKVLRPSSMAKRYIEDTKSKKSMISPAGEALIKRTEGKLSTNNMLRNPVSFLKTKDKRYSYAANKGITGTRTVNKDKANSKKGEVKQISKIKSFGKRLGLDVKDVGKQGLTAMAMTMIFTAESGDDDTVRRAHKMFRYVGVVPALPGAFKAVKYKNAENLKGVKRLGHKVKNAGRYFKGFDINKVNFEIEQLEKVYGPLSLDQHNKLNELKQQRDKWMGKKYAPMNLKTIRKEISKYGKYSKYNIKKLNKEINALKKKKILNANDKKLLDDLTKLLGLKQTEKNLIKNLGSLRKISNFIRQSVLNKLYDAATDVASIDGFMKIYGITSNRYFRTAIKASLRTAMAATRIAYRSTAWAVGKVAKATGLTQTKAAKQLKAVTETIGKGIHGGAYNAVKSVGKHAPKAIKTGAKAAKGTVNTATKIKTSPIKRSIKKVGQMLTSTIKNVKVAVNSLLTSAAAAKAAIAGIAGAGTLLPIIIVIMAVVLSCGLVFNIVFDDTDNIKKYVEYINTKVEDFQDEIEEEAEGDWHSVSYEFPLKDTYDNSKEILSMTAVYIEQKWPGWINFISDYKTKRYIDNLFEKSHWIDTSVTYHEYEVGNDCDCEGECTGGHGTHTEYCDGDLVISVSCVGADEVSDPNLANFHWLDPMFAIDDIGSSGISEQGDLIADNFVVKYYCGENYPHECNDGINFGVGPTGTTLKANKSIAVDPTLIPIGTHVILDGREYIADDDRNGTIVGNEIHIYVRTHIEAMINGIKHNKSVYWMRDVAVAGDFEGWTDNNKEWAWNIFCQNWVEVYGIGVGGGAFISSPILEEEMEEIIDKIKTQFTALTAQREALIRNGLQLVGSVPYFWGGGHHSGLSPDIDPTWGTEYRTITAPGSSIYVVGSSWPYGLDCSGFTRWVILATTGTDSMWAGATAQRTSMGSLAITRSQLLPGDFANTSDDGHVGIYLYTDPADGKMVFLHCSPSVDGVGINKPGYFTQFYRPRTLL